MHTKKTQTAIYVLFMLLLLALSASVSSDAAHDDADTGAPPTENSEPIHDLPTEVTASTEDATVEVTAEKLLLATEEAIVLTTPTDTTLATLEVVSPIPTTEGTEEASATSEPTPADISPEPTLVCPASMTVEVIQDRRFDLFRDRMPTSAAYSIQLTEPAEGILYVASMAGHPERSCQIGSGNDNGRYPCDQQQNHEEFTIAIDGVQVAFVPDHGEDKWQIFTFPLEALSAGTHQIDFVHTGLGNSAESVAFKALLCSQAVAIGSPVPSSTPPLTPASTPTATPTTEPSNTPTNAPSGSVTPVQTPTPGNIVTDTPILPDSTATPSDSLSIPPTPPQLPSLETTVEIVAQPGTDCGAITESGVNGFPTIDLSPCLPDTSVINREPWSTIQIGAEACPDWLAYHTNLTGDWEIFRLGDLPDGTEADPNLSRGVGVRVFDIMPSFAPDHRWITFVSNRDGNWEIYVSAVEEALIQRVTYNSFAVDLNAAWSPAGTQIVYQSNRDGNWDLYSFDVSTGLEQRLTTDPASDINPAWSSDGSNLLFQSDRDGGTWQLYRLSISTGDVERIDDAVESAFDAAYAPDTQHIVFRSNEADQRSVIYLQNLSSGQRIPISDPSGAAFNPVWSPDSSLIAYQSNSDGDNDIYVYEIETGLTQEITENAIEDYAPTWWCDSTTLVFTSDITGDANLFSVRVRPAAAAAMQVESEASQLTFVTAADQYPLNSPSDEDASQEQSFPPAVQNR